MPNHIIIAPENMHMHTHTHTHRWFLINTVCITDTRSCGTTEHTHLSFMQRAPCATCTLSKNKGKKVLLYLTQESKIIYHRETLRLQQVCVKDAVIAFLTISLLQMKTWTKLPKPSKFEAQHGNLSFDAWFRWLTCISWKHMSKR